MADQRPNCPSDFRYLAKLSIEGASEQAEVGESNIEGRGRDLGRRAGVARKPRSPALVVK